MFLIVGFRPKIWWRTPPMSTAIRFSYGWSARLADLDLDTVVLSFSEQSVARSATSSPRQSWIGLRRTLLDWRHRGPCTDNSLVRNHRVTRNGRNAVHRFTDSIEHAIVRIDQCDCGRNRVRIYQMTAADSLLRAQWLCPRHWRTWYQSRGWIVSQDNTPERTSTRSSTSRSQPASVAAPDCGWAAVFLRCCVSRRSASLRSRVRPERMASTSTSNWYSAGSRRAAIGAVFYRGRRATPLSRPPGNGQTGGGSCAVQLGVSKAQRHRR